MKKKKYIAMGIILATILVSITLLQSDTLKIESLDHQVLSFAELPETVKDFYFEEACSKEYKEIFVSTNPEIDSISFKKYTIDNIFELAKYGFVYEFYINGKFYTLNANKGDPFVFDNGYFFYTEELNLNQDNYKYSKYIKVRVQNE